MVDLRTTYMGIELKNPIVVGSCSLSKRIDTIKRIEEAGAGALVIKSLFEEQIQLEQAEMDHVLSQFDEMYAEMLTLFPKTEHGGAREHLYWVEKARKETSLPLIGSLNATRQAVWVDYAKRLADTGVDGLELNFYSLPLDAALRSDEIEKQEFETFAAVRDVVKLPIAVKLQPFYTNVLRVATEFDRLGADAIVMFNRLFHPDIDIEKERECAHLRFGSSSDSAVTLRWTAILFDRLQADIVSSRGIETGHDVVKMVLAGATAVQVVSTIYQNGVAYLGGMLNDVVEWMENKGYSTLSDFRGTASKARVRDPWSFERAQYIKALLGFD
jgi:dihydroorotate dehydrogenase (fumarate)